MWNINVKIGERLALAVQKLVLTVMPRQLAQVSCKSFYRIQMIQLKKIMDLRLPGVAVMIRTVLEKYCNIQTIDVDEVADSNELKEFAVNFEKEYGCDSSDFSAPDTKKRALKEAFEDYCGLNGNGNNCDTNNDDPGIPTTKAEECDDDTLNTPNRLVCHIEDMSESDKNLFRAMLGVGKVYF